MPVRFSRRWPTAVALAGLFAFAVSLAPGQPAPAPQDKKNRDKKPTDRGNSVQITWRLNDFETNWYPYELKVTYTAEEDNLEVAIDHSGKEVWSQDAPKGTGALTFKLDFGGDTTGAHVTAKLRVKKKKPEDVLDSDTRIGLTFISEGGMGGMRKWTEPFKFDVPKGAKLAERAKKDGDPIAAGFHHGHFPFYDAPILGASARMWIQGRFKPPVPLKTDYDLPMVLAWLPRNGKWQPAWGVLLTEPLQAGPFTPGGEEPLTLVRVVLLDHKGKVLHIMLYNQ